MQGVSRDAVRALRAMGNAAERRLRKSEITIIYWSYLGGVVIGARYFSHYFPLHNDIIEVRMASLLIDSAGNKWTFVVFVTMCEFFSLEALFC